MNLNQKARVPGQCDNKVIKDNMVNAQHCKPTYLRDDFTSRFTGDTLVRIDLFSGSK